VNFRRRGDKLIYRLLDRECIGRECWNPGVYQHRGAVLSGSRNTGNETPCCMCNAYHGCPVPKPDVNKELIKIRKAEGWRAS
jgi:hypothetical protein